MQVDWQDAQTDIILFVRSEAAGMVTGKQGRTSLTAQTDFLLCVSLLLNGGNLLHVLGTDCCNADIRYRPIIFLSVCSMHSDHRSRRSHCT